MESRAKMLGHPVHPMLVVFPLGLFMTAVAFDICFLWSGRLTFASVAMLNIGVGIVMGLVAAVFGTVDWLAIPERTRAKRLGLLHGAGNVVVVLLFVVSFWLRWTSVDGAPPLTALAIGVCGVALVTVTGWLGGELVDRLGVGVDDGAHLNAPSSLDTHKVPIGAVRSL